MFLTMCPASCSQTRGPFGSEPHPLASSERIGLLPAPDCRSGSLDEALTQRPYCILHVPVHCFVGERIIKRKGGEKNETLTWQMPNYLKKQMLVTAS